MTENTQTQSTPESSSSVGGFNISKYRLSQNFGSFGGADKLLTTVLVRKPRKDEFIRVHPGGDFVVDVALLEYGENRETYLLAPQVQDLGIGHPTRLHLVVDRSDNPFIWPLKLPKDENRQSHWHLSAIEAAEHAKSAWTRVAANMKIQSYEIFKARGELPDPEWPKHGFDELLEIAFRHSTIDTAEHRVLLELEGSA